MFSRELKKGSTELLILSLVESRPRHGYDIGKLIELRSGGNCGTASRPCIPSCAVSKNVVSSSAGGWRSRGIGGAATID